MRAQEETLLSPVEVSFELYCAREVVAEMRAAPVTEVVRGTLSRRQMVEADLAHWAGVFRKVMGVSEPTLEILPEVVDALKQLFSATRGYGWLRREGWVGREKTRLQRAVPACAVDCATWAGVFVDRANQSVKHLDLACNNLDGELPGIVVRCLKRLEVLRLHSNNLFGEVPSAFGDLPLMLELDLSNNQLTGALPAALGRMRSLTHLDLSGNRLAGPVPAEFGDLGALRFLALSCNRGLCGAVPDALGRLFALLELDLAQNAFESPVPHSLARLPSLRRLDLSQNRFTGPLPALAASVVEVSLAHNRFCGPVRLHTGFDGPVWPPHCANSPFTRLTALFLHHNELDGLISPHLIARLGQLRFLNLSHNNLKGLFPATVTSLTHLQCLDLSHNPHLHGHVHPMGLEKLPLVDFAGAGGPSSQLLGRTRRFDVDRFRCALQFQTVYASRRNEQHLTPVQRGDLEQRPTMQRPETGSETPPEPPPRDRSPRSPRVRR